MHAASTEQISLFAQRWRRAGHGEKSSILDEAVRCLGLSKQTVYRKFKEVVVINGQRKRRSDAGTSSISREEAAYVSATALEHMRKNGKRQQKMENTVEVLRANNLIAATRVDKATGEVVPMSTAAISRAMRTYKMHPDQILRPAPAVRLASLHPNHVWQIDPSRCVMYYLPRSANDNGLRIATESEFYKNKPANLVKAIKDALWRYVITDHRSGWVYTEYVVGGETAENITNVLINCMIQRTGEAMHGVPVMIMLDAGSANTSAIFRNLCQAMRIRMHVTKPGNPRSKGSVEKGNDLVEREFESMLKTLPQDRVQTLEQINQLATKWRAWYNGKAIHTRHGMTRDAAWLKIQASELIIAPAEDVMRELAVTAPESRVVSTFLTVNYKGREYDVSQVPGVMVGEKLLVCRNPSREISIQAICTGEDRRVVYHVLPACIKDEFGQYVDAPIIGEAYAAHADTPAVTAGKHIEMLATGTESLEEAQKVRKAKRAGLFNGQYDPLAHMHATPAAAPITRRGTAHELDSVRASVVMPALTHIQAAKLLKEQLGSWSPRHYNVMIDIYPESIPADQLQQAAQAIDSALSESNVIPLRVAG